MQIIYNEDTKTLFVSAMTLSFQDLLKVTKAVGLADEPNILIEFGIFPEMEVPLDGELSMEDAQKIINYIDEDADVWAECAFNKTKTVKVNQ